ncbi:hypothetical protein CGT94_18655 [Vibrio metoecus]|uniref:hypothetical protein n=1 Tax=Vibrio metoecus TaxID=1481663 RepID=UPI0006D83C5F|nr:hypothetical protein [Vibrio metoecus]KQB01659.1 hypothetical protein XV93_16750 [Vibrio metoecus]PAR45078.1 hypothetical protein CGT94_18655 [Vibrio metoecus]
MNLRQLLSAIFELLLLIFLSFQCLVLVVLLGWWLPVSNGLTNIIERLPGKVQWVLLPVSFALMLCMPFYAIASIGIVGLKHSKERLKVIFQNMSDSFK